MAVNADLIADIERIITSREHARNRRGGLAAALRTLPVALNRALACDYAEHVLWICTEAAPGESRFHAMVAEIRRFLDGTATPSQVAHVNANFFRASYDLSGASDAAVGAVSAIGLATAVCCQRDLEALGVIARTRFRPSASDVADQAAFAVAKRAAGSAWDSDVPQLRREARLRGKAASEGETEWQIARLRTLVASLDPPPKPAAPGTSSEPSGT